MANPPLEEGQIKRIVEAALLASDGPLTVANLTRLFGPGELDEEQASKQVRDAVKALQGEAEERGVELRRIASGYRYQVRQELSTWVSRLWDEKPPRYTRALLETLSIIIYKQPVTRGDIEQIRGVGVSQNIMRTLVERDWIKVVGQKEVPGRPSLYGTTRALLDYFSLKSLDELPPLSEIKALIEPKLVEEDIAVVEQGGEPDGAASDAAGSSVQDESPSHENVADESDTQDESAEAAVRATADADQGVADGAVNHADAAPGIEVSAVLPDDAAVEDGAPSAEVVPLHGAKSAN
ncbi:MAG: SMC-Scp complex subunit ScpB [Pseudomonadota bacterium]